MIPEISEFSYGFALTNELVGWVELLAAPIFPSLLEEGKAGGGYDVKLDRPGAPLYLQFKRSECMTRRSAREYRSIRDQGGRLSIPYYRFLIAEKARSDQHELLLALDTAPNHVYYVAPKFHRRTEINDAWHESTVASRSIFVSPSEIGSLDDKRHTVSFYGSNHWVCSDPRPIRALSSREVLEKIQRTLREDARPLRVLLSTLVEEQKDAQRRGRAQIIEKRRHAAREAAAQRDAGLIERAARPILTPEDELIALETPEPMPPTTREPKPLEGEQLALREASDMAARVFDAQLIIVQAAE